MRRSAIVRCGVLEARGQYTDPAAGPSPRFWLGFHVAVAAYYTLLVLTRRIDADEGYFLYAAQLVTRGGIPYRDFFFPQMPMLPYLWGWARGPAAALAALAVVLLLLEPYRALERRWPTWTWRPATPEARDEFDDRLATVRAVSQSVDALAPPGAVMLTWWPGYAVGARTPVLAGLENQFGLRVGHDNDDRDTLGRLHVLDAADVHSAIERRAAAVVVVGLWAGAESWLPRSYYERLLSASGYVIRTQIGSAAIYTAPGIK